MILCGFKSNLLLGMYTTKFLSGRIASIQTEIDALIMYVYFNVKRDTRSFIVAACADNSWLVADVSSAVAELDCTTSDPRLPTRE